MDKQPESKIAVLKALLAIEKDPKKIVALQSWIAQEEVAHEQEIQAWAELLMEYREWKQQHGGQSLDPRPEIRARPEGSFKKITKQKQ